MSKRIKSGFSFSIRAIPSSKEAAGSQVSYPISSNIIKRFSAMIPSSSTIPIFILVIIKLPAGNVVQI